MDANELAPGMRVRVHYDSDVRESKEAIVLRVPPFAESVAGEEVEYTDKIEVKYPNTSIDGGGLFGDIRETIELDNVEPA